MPTVKNVESKIHRVEGFNVRIHYSEPGGRRGRDVRSDRARMRQYGYIRAAGNNTTVAEWIKKRFARTYPGLTVEVLDADGHPVHGRTKLSTLRASYE